MSAESLTLTAYFAERERSDGHFLADQILTLFQERRIATSVLLRGIASFGVGNIALSDRSLSLSEDPPVAIAAVDSAEQIASIADALMTMTGRGVITLRRGRDLPGVTPEYTGDVRLSLYLGRRQRVAGVPGYIAVCDVLRRLGFTAAEVLLGVDGTVAGQRRRARFFSRNAEVPLVVAGVGPTAQAVAAVDELRGMLPDLVFTVEPVLVCKNGGEKRAGPAALAGEAPFQRLTVRTAEDTRHDGQPIHRALIQRLKESDHAGGATVLRGIFGYLGAEPPHGDRFLQLARHVPVSTVIIDTAPNIAQSFLIAAELTDHHGLITCEPISAMVARYDGHGVGNLRLD